jgi:hypothetical protein
MAYVPPHLRNKKQQEVPRSNSSRYERPRSPTPVPSPVAKLVEDSFPVLGNGTQRSSWIGRKFADLASEWNEDDERRKEDAEIIKAQQRHDYTVVLPRFQNIRKFEEPEDMEVEASRSNEDSADGWKTIERKKPQQKPRDKTFEEYEKEEEKKDENDDTVWDIPEHETCWDERY